MEDFVYCVKAVSVGQGGLKSSRVELDNFRSGNAIVGN